MLAEGEELGGTLQDVSRIVQSQTLEMVGLKKKEGR